MNEEKSTVNSVQELQIAGLSPLALDVNQLLWPTSLEHSYIPTSVVQAPCGMSSSVQYNVPSSISTATAVSIMQTSRSESSGAIWVTQASKSATSHDNHIHNDSSIMDSKSHFDVPELRANREFCQIIGTTAEMTGIDDIEETNDCGIGRKRKGKFEEDTEVEHQYSNDVSYNNTLNSKMPVNGIHIGDNPMKHHNEDYVVPFTSGNRGDTEPEASKPVRKPAKPFKKACRKNKEKTQATTVPKAFGKLETNGDSIIHPKLNEEVGHSELLSSPSTFDLHKIEDVQRNNAVKAFVDIHMAGLNTGSRVNGKNGQKMMLEEFKQDKVDLNDPKTKENDGHFDLLSSPSTFDLHQIEDVQRKNSIIKGVGDFHITNINTDIHANGRSGQKMILEKFKQDKVDLNVTKVNERIGQSKLMSSPTKFDKQQTEAVRRQSDDVNCVADFQVAYLSTETSLNGKSGHTLKLEANKEDKMDVYYTGNDTPQRNENDSRSHADIKKANSDTETIEGPCLNSSPISCDNGKYMEPTGNSFDARTNNPHKNADCPLSAEHVEANLDDSDIDAISQIMEGSRETDDGDRGQDRNSVFGILGVYCRSGVPCLYDSDATNQNDTVEAVAYLGETHAFGDDSMFGILGVYCGSALHCWDRNTVEEG